MGELEPLGPIGSDPTQVVTQSQGDQRHRDQGGPHEQANAVKWSEDARSQHLDHHNGSTG